MSTTAAAAATVTAPPDTRPAPDARFAASGTLIRLIVRRDRVRLPVWVLACVFTVVSVFRSYEQLFPTVADRASLQTSMSAAPSLALLFGTPRDLGMAGPYTVWRGGWFAALLLAIFAALTVVRHTRDEEDTGRAELVVSGVVGRYAVLTAALGVVLAASALSGALVALSMIAGGTPAAGSLAFGAALALTGAVFAGVGAVAAQVGSFARTANGIGLAVVGVAYLLRGWGDAGDIPALSWISPLGWTNEVRPYTANRWWVLAIQAAAGAALVALAAALSRRRDLGLGLVAPRDGRAYAPRSLRGVGGLMYRLHRATLAGWGVGLVLAAIVFGSLAPSVANAFGDNKQMREIIERMGGSAASMSVQFVASMSPLFGIAAALYGVQAMLRLHTEEV
ncbi:MAG TPA: ABC transporter permease, partial [Jatrophihabitans sp.]|nr:ABC transporter permease [Jatrophihabitans sp.]